MDPHFRAFSFVDRITAVEPGVRVRGTYAIPSGLKEFPSSLVAEATGQLAAWSAMAKIDFSHRPVAGIAGRVELLGEVKPGQTLELSADLETADTEAVAYGGEACVNGVPVLRLHHCVGPMMPGAEFDDPELLRQRFALLCGTGATPGAFPGVPDLVLQLQPGDPGQVARATLAVPTDAPFFADHFPRRPVFPGTLLMNMNLKLAATLAAELAPPGAGQHWAMRAVADMKLRSFMSPGEILDLEVKLAELQPALAVLNVSVRRGKRSLGTANVELHPEAVT